MRKSNSLPYLIILIFIAAFSHSSLAQTPVSADVIVVIDESGSMRTEQAWITEAIPFLETELKANGIGSEAQQNLFGLVGFGNRQVVPRSINVGDGLLGSESEFVTAAANLVTSGGTEDGWRGIEFALSEYERRNGAVVNIILVTDEDRDNTLSSITYQTVLDNLNENRALLNAVLRVNIQCEDGTQALGMDAFGNGYVADGSGSFLVCANPSATNGAGSTIANYVDLAIENGGAVWDLSFLRNGGLNAESFTEALLAIKVDEILNQRPLGDIVAVAQATPNPALVNQTITLDGSASFHQIEARNIVAWDWDLDNDGIFDTSGPIVTTTFPALGDYPITLRVTDNDSTPQSAQTEIIVNVNLPPLPPTAIAGGPYLFCPQTAVWRLDGRNSVNPDDGLSEPGLPENRIISYEWDLNNDQIFDDANTAFVDATTQLTSLGVGDHIIRLKVTDNNAESFPSSGRGNLFDTQVTQVSIRDASDLLCNCLTDFAARPKQTKVQLTWTDTGASSYAVYRSENEGGPYTRIAQTDNRYSTYLDPSLDIDTTYYYVVDELNSSGQAICRSREISATPTARRLNNRNVAPSFISTPVNIATEGESYQYTALATDPDRRDSVTYALQVSPTGMTINAQSGLINWTPLNAQVGLQSIVLRAIDNQGAFSEQVFTISVANTNQAPTIFSTPDSSGVELTEYLYQVSANDPDLGDVLSYRLSVAPDGMSIDSNTGLITWTPALGQQGDFDVTVLVSDVAGLSDSQSFSISVIERNIPPLITSQPIVSATATETYVYEVTASDGNGDSLTFALGDFPEGLTIEPLSGIINWTPPEALIGSQQALSIIVTDQRGASGTQTFSILVKEPNKAPVITTQSLPPAQEDTLYVQTLIASDENMGDMLTFSATEAPGNLRIDAQSGEIRWLPVNNNVGDNVVVLRVTDAAGLFDEKSFTVNVQNSGDAPTISSEPGRFATVGESFQYQVVATDPDNSPLSYSLINTPSNMLISNTGLFTWVPNNAQVGSQPVTIRVTDVDGQTDEQSFSLLVGSVSVPVAPIIESSPVTVATSNTVYQYLVVASDGNNDPLTYTALNSPLGLVINPNNGLIQWVPSAQQLGPQAITISVSDPSGLNDIQTFNVIVSDTPASNSPPTISSIPSTNAFIDTPYSYAIAASDPDGGVLSYELLSSVNGMRIDAQSGLIEWTPTAAQVGSNNVVVRVNDDAGGFIQQTFPISVAQQQSTTNESPVISSSPVLNAAVGSVYNYPVIASDADGDSIRYELNLSPEGMVIDQTTGNISWVPRDNQININGVEVVAIDTKGAETVQRFSIQVEQNSTINRAPQIVSSANLTALVGQAYQYQVVASDADNDELSLRLANAPTGMTIDNSSGLISWTPSLQQAETQAVSVVVSDQQSQTQQSFLISVAEFALPLDVNINISPLVADSGEEVRFTVIGKGGIENRVLSLSINGIDTAINQGQASTIAEQPGRYTVVASVTSGDETVSISDAFTVRDPLDTDIPIAELTSPEFSSEIFGVTTVLGTAFDLNLAEYRLLVAPKDSGDFFEISTSTSRVQNGQLGTIDPTLLRAGIYDLLLEVIDLNGNKTIDSSVFEIAQDTPVGNFSIGFQDLVVPLGGLSVSVNRNYDSRDRQISGDFGFGWSVDYQDVDIQESQDLGDNFVMTTVPGTLFFPNRCIEPDGPHFVKIKLPERRALKFNVVVQNNCSILFPPLFVSVGFEPAPGTEGTLSANNSTGLIFNGGRLLDIGRGTFDPDVYTLTTKEGYTYILDQNFGIRRIEDQSGNQLNYTNNGIVHSSGQGLDFVRDSNNRITQVTGPDGESINYTYNANGDLSSITDREGNKTTYQYNRNHGLIEINDPLGRSIGRTIYDDDGRMLKMVDAEGNELVLERDLDINQETIRDQNGNATIYTYDDRGNVLSTIDALGNETTFTFDDEDNKTSQTDARGYTYTTVFNENDYPTIEIDPLGNTTTIEYTDIGAIASTTFPNGNTTSNVIDNQGNITSVTDGLGNEMLFDYDAQGNQTSQTDALGHIIRYEHDSRGQATLITDQNGHAMTLEYDINGNQTGLSYSITSEGVESTVIRRTEVDKNNRIIAEIDAYGERVEYQYDAVGNIIEHVDARGFVTSHEYDTRQNKTRTVYPDGTEETHVYDGMSNLVSTTDRDGRTSTFVYDALNRHSQTIFADNTQITKEYDANGNLVAEIDRRGNRTEHEYDAANRMIAKVDALGNRTQYEYDPNGNLIKITDALGRETTHTYDSDDKKIATTYDDGTESRTEYDAIGQIVSVTDQAGQVMEYEYDPRGKLLRVINELGDATSYTYDEVGNKVSETDAEGRVTQFVYDKEGRIVKHTLPNGLVSIKDYDAIGNVVRKVDFNGDEILYEFDSNNRLVRKTLSDGIEHLFEYTNTGEIATMTDETGVTRYFYDVLDRLVEVQYSSGDFVKYSYDAEGNQTSLEIAQGTIEYQYDALNRIISTIDMDGGETTYRYNEVGSRTSVTLPNGNQTLYQYSNLDRLIELTQLDGDGNTLSSYRYTLGPAGNRLSLTENTGRVTTYTYDNVYRLTSETVSSADGTISSSTYEYDAVGNRISKTVDGTTTNYNYDVNDRLISVGDTFFGYDGNGNRVSKTTFNNVTNYAYDKLNRLVSTDENGLNASYTYDAMGNRRSMLIEGITHLTYLVDLNSEHSRVIAETNGLSNNTTVYTYGVDLISQKDNDGISYFHFDGNHSTRLLSDSSGQVTDTYTYEAFGQVVGKTGTTKNVHLFTGERVDPNTGFYYLRARYYDPSFARFLTMDTFPGFRYDPLTLHKYNYVHNDPINNFDPDGRFVSASFVVRANAIVMSHVARVGPAFATSRLYGGVVIRSLGYAVEKIVFLILRKIPGANISRNVQMFTPQGKRHFLDFVVKVKDRVLNLEVKYQIPPRSGQALNRLVSQLQAAQNAGNGGRVAVFAFKPPSPAAVARLNKLLGPNASAIDHIYGFMELVIYLTRFFRIG
ncbi:putative Ig domain-containing protein [Glaciecola sp. MH2013]|uniref:putative Ig domain-containing protein n=1 Tax=Glaciecola sp. MH2013 TaxID=2785524 RepID=UPI00189DFB36|nr:putative Ig domain-containing protein [Glaciecola sp. MH2013]MBF7073465.1 putative Ig domain-containing protein [Glaciecola sp. MH2013]